MIVLFWMLVVAAYCVLVGYLAEQVARRLHDGAVPGNDAWREFWRRGQG